MNNPTTVPLTKENILKSGMTPEQMAELLVAALEGQRATAENMQRTVVLLEAASLKIAELESKVSTQEAELLVLRNKP